jgi:hypothetical protein
MMHISRKGFLSLVGAGAASLAFPGTAAAQRSGYRWEIFNAGRVKWEIPAPWITTVNGNILTTKPNDGSALNLEFVGISDPTANLGAIVKEELNKRINNLRLTEPEKPIAQNGMTGSHIRGEGNHNVTGENREFKAFVLLHADKRGLLAMAHWKLGEFAKHQKYIDVIYGSIQPNK